MTEGIHFENMIHHYVCRIAQRFEMTDRCDHQLPASFARNAGHDNQAGMDRLGRDQLAEVDGIFGNKRSILREAAGQYLIVSLAETAIVPRMQGIMLFRGVEAMGDRR